MAPLPQGYFATAYRVTGVEPAIEIRAGERCPALDRLLEQRRVTSWAFITAWNPMSQPLPLQENRERAARLAAELGTYTVLAGLGVPDEPVWTPEESLLVLGIGEGDAVALARRYRQRAIVAGESGGVARLVECA